MKYLRSIFESLNKVEVTGVSGFSVDILNPDGKKVNVKMEVDGEWEDWVDPPYTKAVSISGSDDTYEYYMTAYGDENSGYDIEELDIDYKKLSEIENDRKEREAKNKIRMEELDKEREIEKEKRKNLILKSGLSEIDYSREELLKRQLDSDRLKELIKLVDSTNYVIAKVRETEFYEGKPESSDIVRYKVPYIDIVEMGDPDYLTLPEDFGFIVDTEGLLNKANILRTPWREEFIGIEDPTIYKDQDHRNFIERAPFFSIIDGYLNNN